MPTTYFMRSLWCFTWNFKTKPKKQSLSNYLKSKKSKVRSKNFQFNHKTYSKKQRIKEKAKHDFKTLKHWIYSSYILDTNRKCLVLPFVAYVDNFGTFRSDTLPLSNDIILQCLFTIKLVWMTVIVYSFWAFSFRTILPQVVNAC